MGREYVCLACGVPMVESLVEKRTEADVKVRFGVVRKKERGDVCDPCFLKFMAEVTDVLFGGDE